MNTKESHASQPDVDNLAGEDQDNTQTGESDTPAPDAATDNTRIAQLESDLAVMKDNWLRAKADTENIRKRAERDMQETRKYAVAAFAGDVINVAENLFRAMESIPEDVVNQEGEGLVKTVYAGVDMTLKQLMDMFERHGIKRVNPLGQPFDHNYHQAVTQIETPDSAPGTVVQVMQAGYMIHDRLLRPAMVGVAKAPSTQDPRPTVDTTA